MRRRILNDGNTRNNNNNRIYIRYSLITLHGDDRPPQSGYSYFSFRFKVSARVCETGRREVQPRPPAGDVTTIAARSVYTARPSSYLNCVSDTIPTAIIPARVFPAESDKCETCHARRPNEYRRVHVHRTIPRDLSLHRILFAWLQFVTRPESKNVQIHVWEYYEPPHRQSTVICLSLHCKRVIIINRTKREPMSKSILFVNITD